MRPFIEDELIMSLDYDNAKFETSDPYGMIKLYFRFNYAKEKIIILYFKFLYQFIYIAFN